MPSVSVLMPVYNGERWLSDAILSVLNQSFSGFECIIVNDGSTDDSLEIINQYAGSDRRIHVVNKKNTGPSDSLNCGLRIARGKWIARIDADDVWESTKLEVQLKHISLTPGCVLMGTGSILIDQHSIKGDIYRYPRRHHGLVAYMSSLRSPFASSSVLFNASIVRELGGYRVRIKRAEDLDLWLRLSHQGKVISIDEPLVQIRKHQSQISNDERGHRMLIYSCVVITSYWLRKMGDDDPVVSDSERDFCLFYDWISQRLSEEGVFQDQLLVDELKCQVKEMSTKWPVSLFSLHKLVRYSAVFFRRSAFHLWGSGLSKRLAYEWINRP